MLLALDIGNSQTSYGVFDGDQLKHHWRCDTKARTSDEIASFLLPLLSHVGVAPADLQTVIVCSVVPSADYAAESFGKHYLGVPVFKIHSGLKLGCRLNVDFPGEVGADRLANAAYAAKYLKLPAIVVDMGTATTFDVVSDGAVYEGGVILPGVRIAVEGLGTKTSKLPVVDLKFPKHVIGKNTADCIQSGILFGYCDLLDGLLDRVTKELGAEPHIVLTGGVAPLLHARLRHHTDLLPNLTLDGMRLLFDLNRG